MDLGKSSIILIPLINMEGWKLVRFIMDFDEETDGVAIKHVFTEYRVAQLLTSPSDDSKWD